MAYDFKKLSEVGSLDEFPEGAKVLIEHDGDIKRCASDGLGGGGGFHFIYLDVDTQTHEITCDEEITFESLREDIANGIMPAAIIDMVMESEHGSNTMFMVIPLVNIQEGVEAHAAVFMSYGTGIILQYEDGQYTWTMGG